MTEFGIEFLTLLFQELVKHRYMSSSFRYDEVFISNYQSSESWWELVRHCLSLFILHVTKEESVFIVVVSLLFHFVFPPSFERKVCSRKKQNKQTTQKKQHKKTAKVYGGKGKIRRNKKTKTKAKKNQQNKKLKRNATKHEKRKIKL